MSKEKDQNKLKERLSYWLGNYWIEFDNIYMKPKLIYNWPKVKDEHDEISQIIKGVISDYSTHKRLPHGEDSECNSPDVLHHKPKSDTDLNKSIEMIEKHN